MARTDSFNNFLTDIATAIRTKTGGTEQIQATQFDKEIENISGGDELIAEYVINDSTTTKVDFNNLSIAVGDIYYLIIEGNLSSYLLGISINNEGYTGYGYYIDLYSGGSTACKSGKKLGCNRDAGRVMLNRKGEYFYLAGIGSRYGTSSAFDIGDETTPINQITIHAKYSSTTETFPTGTKIQLYKKPA